MTLSEVQEMVSMLSATYSHSQNKELSVFTMLCADVFRDDPADLIQAAALYHIKTSQYFPSIYDLEKAKDKLNIGEPSAPGIDIAWKEIQSGISNFGYNRWSAVKFSSPLIEEAARIITPLKLNQDENTAATFAHFKTIYETLCKRKADDKTIMSIVKNHCPVLPAAKVSPECQRIIDVANRLKNRKQIPSPAVPQLTDDRVPD